MTSKKPDPEQRKGLSLLTSKVGTQVDEIKQRGRTMLEHRDSYERLHGRLGTLSGKTRHSVMVPLTSKAFMPGELVHTNEMTVLLGDNWFVETSASHAGEIAKRRLDQCDSLLVKVEEELRLVQGWQEQTNKVSTDSDKYKDIREEYDEGKEAEWKKHNRENMKKEKLTGSKEEASDEDMWKRLEELEVREELEKQWDEDDEETTESEEESESDEVSDECDEDERDEGLSFQNLGNTSEIETISPRPKLGRRVSWGGEQVMDAVPNDECPLDPESTIVFDHSDALSPVDSYSGQSQVPDNPSDLHHFVCQQPRSILKPCDSPILVKETDSSSTETFDNAVGETVLERAVIDMPVKEMVDAIPKEEPKKISRFKASRQQNK